MHRMSDDRSAYEAFGSTTVGRSRADSRSVFGQTMGLVAFTVAFAALGAYLGKDITGMGRFLGFVVAFGCLLGLNAAAARSESLAITLLFVVGLCLGLSIAPVVNYYLEADPGVVYQAAGATGLFVGGLGAYGYATSKDLSGLYRYAFWALLGLIVFGLVLLFVAIPGGNIIYAVAGLAIFGVYTVIDFNRLRRSGMDQSVLLAAGIFLDIINIFQFFLMLFGGGSRD